METGVITACGMKPGNFFQFTKRTSADHSISKMEIFYRNNRKPKLNRYSLTVTKSPNKTENLFEIENLDFFN